MLTKNDIVIQSLKIKDKVIDELEMELDKEFPANHGFYDFEFAVVSKDVNIKTLEAVAERYINGEWPYVYIGVDASARHNNILILHDKEINDFSDFLKNEKLHANTILQYKENGSIPINLENEMPLKISKRSFLSKGMRVNDDGVKTGTWVEGYYQKRYNEDNKDAHLIFNSKSFTNWEYASIDPHTLCSATDRLDGNGKMIYEHDYLRYGRQYYVVRWSNDDCMYKLYSCSTNTIIEFGIISAIGQSKMFVVGNEFDDTIFMRED